MRGPASRGTVSRASQLSIYLSVYLPIYLSTYLPTYLSIHRSIYLSRYDGDGDAILAATAAEGGGGKGGAMVRRLLGTGPWVWTGVASVGFLRRGVLHTPWGAGRWKPHDSGDGTIVASLTPTLPPSYPSPRPLTLT